MECANGAAIRAVFLSPTAAFFHHRGRCAERGAAWRLIRTRKQPAFLSKQRILGSRRLAIPASSDAAASRAIRFAYKICARSSIHFREPARQTSRLHAVSAPPAIETFFGFRSQPHPMDYAHAPCCRGDSRHLCNSLAPGGIRRPSWKASKASPPSRFHAGSLAVSRSPDGHPRTSDPPRPAAKRLPARIRITAWLPSGKSLNGVRITL